MNYGDTTQKIVDGRICHSPLKKWVDVRLSEVRLSADRPGSIERRAAFRRR